MLLMIAGATKGADSLRNFMEGVWKFPINNISKVLKIHILGLFY